MKPARLPATPTIRVLRQHQAVFTHHPYAYLPHGGTSQSACEQGVEEHTVIKTLIMEDETHRPIIVLMHGDCRAASRRSRSG